ncbi:hypothetical protein [Streptomyces sp. NPDC002845]
MAELVAQGPPDEEVGLDPYGTYGEGEYAPPGTCVPPERAPPTTPLDSGRLAMSTSGP